MLLCSNFCVSMSGLIVADSNLNVTQCVFSGLNTAATGGAIAASGSTITVTSSSFSNCIATETGGGIHLSTSTATIESCTFASTVAQATVDNYLDNVLSNTVEGGGAIFADLSALTVTNCTFTDTSSLKHGGAISCVSSACTLDRIVVTRAMAGKLGGAIFLSYPSPSTGTFTAKIHTIQSSSFDGCRAVEGGTLFGYHPYLTISGSTFTNSATSNGAGGAIKVVGAFAGNPVQLRVDTSTFTGNNATKVTSSNAILAAGGAIKVDEIDAVVATSFFTRNKAERGSSLSFSNSNAAGAVRVDTCTFTQNDGLDSGAVHMAVSTSFLVQSCTFANNVVTTQGAALTAEEVAVGEVVSCTFSENFAESGGAVRHKTF